MMKMNEFKAAPEFSSSLGIISEPRDSRPASLSSSWASQGKPGSLPSYIKSTFSFRHDILKILMSYLVHQN